MTAKNRVTLRPFEESDMERSLKWVNDPDTAAMIDRVLPVTGYEWKKWYQEIIEDRSRVIFAIEEIRKKEHIGNAGFHYIDWRVRKAEIWLYIGDRKMRHKGYGGNALNLLVEFGFQQLHLNRLSLYTPEYNKAAISLYEKSGFKKEGVFIDDIYMNGKYFSSIRMALTKKNYTTA